MFKTFCAVAVLTASALTSAGAWAQTANGGKKELVTKALQLQQAAIEGLGAQLAMQTAQQVMNAAGQALQRAPADKRDALAADIQADVKKFYEEIEPTLRSNAGKLGPTTLGPALEEKLNEDELKTLVAWLDSPVSRKYQRLVAESQQAMAQKLVAESRPVIDPKLKALEQTIARRLGLPAAGAGAAAPAPAKK